MKGDAPEYAYAGMDDSFWEVSSLPSEIPLENGMCWLRSRFPTPPEVTEGPLYLFVGFLDSAAEVYLNGGLIGTRGELGPAFSVPVNRPGVFLLPPGALRQDGGENVLALRLKSPSALLDIPAPEIVDSAAARYENGFITFFNFKLYSILGALCVFIGLYFLALWLGRRRDTPNLWYAVSSWAIGFYFLEMGSEFPLLAYSLNRALAKAGLTVCMASLIAFFIDYFKLEYFLSRRRRFFWAILLAVPAVFTAAYVLFRTDNTAIDAVFSANLLFVQAAIVFIAVITIREVVQGNRGALPLLIGVIVGVGFGTHDVVYSALGLKPFAWLQGIGFFGLNLSLFVSLTQRSTRLYKDLEAYSRDIGQKTRQLSTYLERIEETADSVSAITAEIDADAEAAAASADTLAAEAERIGRNAEKQFQAVQDAGQAVDSLGASLGQVRTGVEAQAAGIGEAADSVAVVADAAAAVSENVSSTADFARGLDVTAEDGRRASGTLREAISRIKDAAGEVNAIVTAVEEFAERTKLLAMNAAIEAAHAGASGRGFAVIANEIKNLARASAERASAIRDSISEIVRRIENGADANEGVSASLDSVAKSAKIALQGILSVGDSLGAQRDATGKLRAALQGLSASAAAIRVEAERQEAEGGRIRTRMEELAAISKDLRSSISGIVRENAAIAETTKRLASVSRDGKEAVAGLRRTLESRKES